MSWYAREVSAVGWRIYPKPKYPFHSAVAKDFGNELPSGDHTVVVKEGLDGDERFFIVSSLPMIYVRPAE